MKIINLTKDKNGVYVQSTGVSESKDVENVEGKHRPKRPLNTADMDMFLEGVDAGINLLEKVSSRVERLLKVGKIKKV